MSRVRVWYDDECDQIFISGETHSFAPRSLICILSGGGSTLYVQMRGTEGSYIAGGSFADFGNHDGLAFDTPEDAKAYLDGVFSGIGIDRLMSGPSVHSRNGKDRLITSPSHHPGPTGVAHVPEMPKPTG